MKLSQSVFPKVHLGKLCNIQIGKTPSRANPLYWGNGSTWLSIADMNDELIADKSKEEITEKAIKESGIKVIRKGTLILSFKLSIGKVSITGKDLYTNEAIAGLSILDNSKVYQKYLYYFLREFDLSGTGDKAVKGLTLNKSKLYNLEIPLPTLTEQQRIATILDHADSIRRKNKQILEKYNELAQSVFYEMFGDPVTNPKGWKIAKLKSLSTRISSGNTPKGGSKVYVEDGIVFFRSQNVWRNNIEMEDVAYIDLETHHKMSKTSLKNGDILMTKTGRINTENSSLGRAAMFLGKDDSANINGHVYLIRLQKNTVKEFILFILTSSSYRDYIRRVCVGGIDKRQINKDHLEEFPIIFPPNELQIRFAEILKCIYRQKVLAKQTLLKSEELFHNLLQGAFKGEL